MNSGAEAKPGQHSNRINKQRKPRKQGHLPFVYWGWCVLLLVATLAFSLIVVRILFSLHILIAPGPVLLLGVFAVTSIISGALFSQVFVRSISRPILEMSNAAQRIAQGDFDITLKEKTFAVEIEEMTEDFTTMAHELAAAEMMSSDFVTNVSHEIKTPLATIDGYAALLENQNLSPEQQQAYTAKIRANAQRLSKLTDDVLLLSHLENNDTELERAAFSLDEQLREVILMHEEVWATQARALTVQLDEVTYCGNADLLFHVWHNLLSNALKFTEKGDAIAVTLTANKTQVVVQMRDSGCGMTEEDCNRVFEKFYQADHSHATEGNGLGLALANHIVALHQGTIQAESKLGEGTTITVSLPR